MVEEVVTTVPPGGGILRRISWPAIFSGTLVALATELLFAAFGLFIVFKLSSPGGITTWSQAWYFVTAFCSLFAGGFVAARIGSNTSGSGAMHGAVTWGLTTVATFMLATWLSWGMVSTSIAAIRTAMVAANTPAVTTTVQGESARMRTEPAVPATTPQQAVAIAAGDASTVSLVIFGGILCGCVASILGGAIGLRPLRLIERRTPVPVA